MSTDEQRYRAELVEIGRRAYAKGLLCGSEGNLSVRLPGGTVLCTPTLVCKGFLQPDELCIVDLNGRKVSGEREPSSEVRLHLEAYRASDAVGAVVHTHAPHATAFGLVRAELPSGILPEVEIFLGQVPRLEFALPGGQELAERIRPWVDRSNAALLANHGAVSWAATLERAFWYTETLEAYCRALLLGRQVGPIERMPADAIRKLLDLRSELGLGDDPRRHGGAPLYINQEFGNKPD